jgi:Domain of unknown function (DUF4132)
MGWIATLDSSYEAAVEDGKVVCRNAAGKRLRSIPKQLKEDPAVLSLRQVVEWLDRHAAECRETAERWMVRSLPVPSVLIAEVWADEAWQRVLRDLVVVPVGADGAWDRDEAGFLRGADARGVGVVNLDGDTVRLTATRIAIPHPVLLADLDDLREFGLELEVQQSLDQLYRETWTVPAAAETGLTGGAPVDGLRTQTQITEYSGGHYDMLRNLTQRATKLGYRVRGGYSVCRVLEQGQAIEARVWLGSDDPYYSAETGNLEFADAAGKSLTLDRVGPVAWSEGHRMAAALYAGRVVNTEGEQ